MLSSIASLTASAQDNVSQPFKGKFYSNDMDISLKIDLYEENIIVPNMDYLGALHGYLYGNGVYGVWMITSCKVEKERKATIHLANDLGSENQIVELTFENDSILTFEQKEGTTIKKVAGKKLQKIVSKFKLKRT